MRLRPTQLTETDGVGALFGDVVNTEESLLNRLAIQVVADLDGNTMIVGPRIHLEGLGQVREILLPDPFEVGSIRANLLDEPCQILDWRYGGRPNGSGGQAIAGLVFIG